MSDAVLFPLLPEPCRGWFSRAREKGLLEDVDRALAATVVALSGALPWESLAVYAVAAALTSAASREGHTLLDLNASSDSPYFEELPERLPAPSLWPALLAGVVGIPERPGPLIFDRGGLYLYRHYLSEIRVAELLGRRLLLDREEPGSSPDTGREILDRLFPLQGALSDPVNAGRAAALASLSRSLLLLTGGPGTGKTWTAARILALHRILYPSARIVAAAPTGKAAARMSEALSAMEFSGPSPPTMTLHRLLGAGRQGFARGPGNLLDWDLVLVDELSMVDLPLMDRLLVSLPERSRLILTGDRNQLASVGTGSVMGDLCGALERGEGAPKDAGALTVLTHNFRQSAAPALRDFAQAIASGDASRAIDLLGAGVPGLDFLPAEPGSRLPLKILREGWDALSRMPAPAGGPLPLDSFMALAPLREGPVGSRTVNRAVQGIFRHDSSGLFPSAPVIVLENSYDTGLMNGDLGILSGSRLFVAKERGLVILPERLAPAWEFSYALTIHKSQGSEFDHVVLLVGAVDHPLLTRSLLYTAATRARFRLTVWASLPLLERMIRRQSWRTSALSDRLLGLLSP